MAPESKDPSPLLCMLRDRVALIDDKPSEVTKLKQAVQASGVDLAAADSFESGVEILRSQPVAYVVLDRLLPWNGEVRQEAGARILQDWKLDGRLGPLNRGVGYSLFTITGSIDVDESQLSRAEGYDGLFRKTKSAHIVRLKELVTEQARVIHRRRRRASSRSILRLGSISSYSGTEYLYGVISAWSNRTVAIPAASLSNSNLELSRMREALDSGARPRLMCRVNLSASSCTELDAHDFEEAFEPPASHWMLRNI